MQMFVACNLIPLGDRLDSNPTVDFLDKDEVGLNGFCSLSQKEYYKEYRLS